MNGWPDYAEDIRRAAAAQWSVLEQDPGLAGPWRQLFKQVQSPRHVLSELLQNADDAGASWASARIEAGCFIFEHNGEDFKPEHFASLCRFGYSNKRELHTIGFRGVGFKSTFSLGEPVDLLTPTLGVRFRNNRFTEPIPLGSISDKPGVTRITVPIQDDHRLEDLRSSLREWAKSPVSLLFFRSLRRLDVDGNDLQWISQGPGPVQSSQWMILHREPERRYLLLRSEEEPFPEEALAEIVGERMVEGAEGVFFPPCRVEVVLGANGRLFVVLPTGVETSLPFACNAPFMQDPARLKIKEPAVSPTNRWLLGRVGRLAALGMLEWLRRGDLPTNKRAAAYGLLPDVDRTATSLEGVCASTVETAFEEGIQGSALLLLDSGAVAKAGCLLPPALVRVWEEGAEAPILDPQGHPALSRHISAINGGKLVNWGLVGAPQAAAILRTMKTAKMPKPRTWGALVGLWAYVHSERSPHPWMPHPPVGSLRLVPVQGHEDLHAAEEVSRIGKDRPLRSEQDWRFLTPHLMAVDPSWVDFLGDASRADAEGGAALQALSAANQLLGAMALSKPSSVHIIARQVSQRFFAPGNAPAIAPCLRLAQIMAKLGAEVPDCFRFFTADGVLRPASDAILWDPDGALSEILPLDWRGRHMLHPLYGQPRRCTAKEWTAWVDSGKAHLRSVPPFESQEQRLQPASAFERTLRGKGVRTDISYPYRHARYYPYQHYTLLDHDFPPRLIEHWEGHAEPDRVWATLVRRLLGAREIEWKDAALLSAKQSSTNGQSWGEVRLGNPPAAWVRRLAARSILPDTRGILRRPNELLRRTAETSPFIGVEPFIEDSLDSDASARLLSFLGVRTTPPGVGAILSRLRSLSCSKDPPLKELGRWYDRLDQILTQGSPQDNLHISQALNSERLIISHAGSWETGRTIFLSEGDGPKGTPVIPVGLRGLKLWRWIGVATEPTVKDLLEWMRGLPVGERLASDDLRWAMAALGRYPVQIWEDGGHWLNLAEEWTPIDSFSWGIREGAATDLDVLHPWVRTRTADLRKLKPEIAGHAPFSTLGELPSAIEWRLEGCAPLGEGPEPQEWMVAIGQELQRIRLDGEEEESRLRGVAARLSATRVQRTRDLRAMPYLEGTPAGLSLRMEVLWAGEILYVEDLPTAKLAWLIPAELGRAFGSPDIKAALDYSFDRSPTKISAYLEQNFRLLAANEVGVPSTPPARSDTRSMDARGKAASNGDDPAEETRTSSPLGVAPGVDAIVVPTPAGDPSAPGQNTGKNQAQMARSSRSTQGAGRLPLMARYAVAQGFLGSEGAGFRHPDGRSLLFGHGRPFPWEERAPGGAHICSYWAREHCLEREPLQIEAERWDLIRESSDRYSLILFDTAERPVRLSGQRLKTLVEAGEVAVHPASYRLVTRND